MWLESRI